MSIRNFQEDHEWGDDTLVSVLIDYIENQQNDEAVMDYLEERLVMSEPCCEDDHGEDHLPDMKAATTPPSSHKEWREQMVKPDDLLPEKQELPPPPHMLRQEMPIAQQETRDGRLVQLQEAMDRTAVFPYDAKRYANDMTKDEVTLSATKVVDNKVVQALLYTLIGYYGNKKVYHPDGASFDVDSLVDTYLRTKEPKGDALAAQLQESSTDSAMHELLEMLPSNDDLFQAYHSFRSQIQARIRSQFPTTKFENF